MSTEAIPAEVLALLRERLHTLEAVEALVVLHDAPRPCSTAEIAERVAIDPAIARSALDELAQGGFVVTEASTGFRYAPVDPATAAATRALVHAYRTAPLDVMRRMTENAMERIRSSARAAFADAFRLGKGRKDEG